MDFAFWLVVLLGFTLTFFSNNSGQREICYCFKIVCPAHYVYPDLSILVIRFFIIRNTISFCAMAVSGHLSLILHFWNFCSSAGWVMHMVSACRGCLTFSSSRQFQTFTFASVTMESRQKRLQLKEQGLHEILLYFEFECFLCI